VARSPICAGAITPGGRGVWRAVRGRNSAVARALLLLSTFLISSAAVDLSSSGLLTALLLVNVSRCYLEVYVGATRG